MHAVSASSLSSAMGTSTRFAADIVASGARRSGDARNAADQTVASARRKRAADDGRSIRNAIAELTR